jgi:pimeloyl-ACP methyl ester carboxylesterase
MPSPSVWFPRSFTPAESDVAAFHFGKNGEFQDRHWLVHLELPKEKQLQDLAKRGRVDCPVLYNAPEWKQQKRRVDVATTILIHGALGTGSQLEPLRSVLGNLDETFIIELEGHGGSPATEDYSIDRFADGIGALMSAHGVKRAALFGYSMGGYVALHLAATRPELVSSVATLGTKLAWTPAVAAREAGRLDPATIRAKVPKYAEALERKHAGSGGWETVLRRTSTLMTDLGEHPVVDDAALARVSVPVRFMVGDRDSVVTVDETAAAARTVPRGELAVLPNTMHPIEGVDLIILRDLLRGALV